MGLITKTIKYSLPMIIGGVVGYNAHHKINEIAYDVSGGLVTQQHEYLRIEKQSSLLDGKRRIPIQVINGFVQLGDIDYRIRGIEGQLGDPEVREKIMDSELKDLVIQNVVNDPWKYKSEIKDFLLNNDKRYAPNQDQTNKTFLDRLQKGLNEILGGGYDE